jgi:hypothetical protein
VSTKPFWLAQWGFDKIGATPPTQTQVIERLENELADELAKPTPTAEPSETDEQIRDRVLKTLEDLKSNGDPENGGVLQIG